MESTLKIREAYKDMMLVRTGTFDLGTAVTTAAGSGAVVGATKLTDPGSNQKNPPANSKPRR